MTAAPDVRLTMSARPEGVAVVRQALAGMADALAFDAAVLADMKMAVSEACTNVVVHAYESSDGILEVDMSADDSGLTILVRDHGSGIQPHATRTRDVPALGLGLPLIAALSDSFELRGSAAGHRGADDVPATTASGIPRRPTRSPAPSARTAAGAGAGARALAERLSLRPAALVARRRPPLRWWAKASATASPQLRRARARRAGR